MKRQRLRPKDDLRAVADAEIASFWKSTVRRLYESGTNERSARAQANAATRKKFRLRNDRDVQRARTRLQEYVEGHDRHYMNVDRHVLDGRQAIAEALPGVTVHTENLPTYRIAIKIWRARALNAEKRTNELESELARLRNENLTHASGLGAYGTIKGQPKKR